MSYRVIALCIVLSCLCVGCINDDAQRAPVIDGWLQTPAREDEYRVKQGDTVYSIAWDFGLDYRDLAAANSLAPPYTLTCGQMLKMTNDSNNAIVHTQAQSRNSYSSYPTMPSSTPNIKYLPVSSTYQVAKMPTPRLQQQQNSTISVSHPVITSSFINKSKKQPPNLPVGVPFAAHVTHWLWPTRGKIVENYSTELAGNHGIDISGVLGQPILATSAGEVVYSGTGVRGYGNLIIIKHNSNYLSAYAYNKLLLVKLGQRVQAGQEIATMGRGDAGRIMLHFEIRFNGQPVNPIILLR